MESERRKSRVCPVQALLSGRDRSVAADLAAMLPLPRRYPAAAIVRGLASLDPPIAVAIDGIKRHRRRKCGCYSEATWAS